MRAFLHLDTYRRNQETLMETPPSVSEEFEPDLELAQQLIDDTIARGQEWLTAIEARQLLRAYDIPVAETIEAATPADAAAAATRLGGPVALKILSPDITHKTDVGGVLLGLDGAAAVEAAAVSMRQRIEAARPEARIDGFMVEQMIRRPGAYELIAGMASDKQFGPVVLFGHGGTSVEVTDDKALALPPLNMRLATEMIERTRIWRAIVACRPSTSMTSP